MTLSPLAWSMMALEFAGFATLVASGAEPPDAIVQLPPMVIEERANVPWLYAKSDDAEYLSRCSEKVTRGYVEMRQSRMEWVRALFPGELFLRMDVPVQIVLVNQNVRAGDSSEVVSDILELNRQPATKRGFIRATTAPNMALNDSDMMGVFVYIEERKFDAKNLTLSSDYVRYLLEARRPALPVWLREGMIAVYDDIEFTKKPITLRPLRWHSEGEARALAKNPDGPRTLLAMSDLFSDEPKYMLSDVGAAQCALLLRWALDPETRMHDAFWRFATAACRQPVTDEMLASYFGFGMSDLRDRLSDYLPSALRGELTIARPQIAREPAEVRRATPAETARIRGEWERLCVPLVLRRHPDEASKYLDQAQRTLQGAYDRGDRDPRTLAVHGLCEVDAGNIAAGEPLLELATSRAVVRPRAYYELARARWKALAVTGEKKPTQEELAGVLQPLRVGMKQSPVLGESAVLLADVLSHEHGPLSNQEVEEIMGLGHLFAADARVCLRLAETLALRGKASEATVLLGDGFWRLHDDPTRREFARAYAQVRPGLSLKNPSDSSPIQKDQ